VFVDFVEWFPGAVTNRQEVTRILVSLDRLQFAKLATSSNIDIRSLVNMETGFRLLMRTKEAQIPTFLFSRIGTRKIEMTENLQQLARPLKGQICWNYLASCPRLLVFWTPQMVVMKHSKNWALMSELMLQGLISVIWILNAFRAFVKDLWRSMLKDRIEIFATPSQRLQSSIL
jgi:hypothetical protein